MFPLLPFAAGLLAGAVAIKMFRSEKALKQLDQAQNRLREATVSGLSAVEQSTARLRDKLQAAAPAGETAAAPAGKKAKAAAPSRKSPAVGKTTAKTAPKTATKRKPATGTKAAPAKTEAGA